MLEIMLDFVRSDRAIRDTILANEDHDDPNFNPSMEAVGTQVAEAFNMDFEESEFGGLWDAICEIIRSE